jgi:hypothetical protein
MLSNIPRRLIGYIFEGNHDAESDVYNSKNL